ncbi:trypsin epsilon [Lepeophtheirus salmonis]|uniref:trypsin epsilon n=1 Tax=Lepeophtheirus salmonis TaxID=72036 RepID=UPI001AE19869|nr:trypsin epsilon-like [Lepeophtheirus salmonis]
MKPHFIYLTLLLFYGSFSVFVASHKSLPYFKNQHSRIIGGQEVEDDSTEYPYQVSFQSKLGDHICGGAILDERIIILAAHCLVGVKPVNTKIVAGVTNLKYTIAQTMEIEKFVPHDKFYYDTASNDIALLHLKEPLSFNEHVKKVELYDVTSPMEATFTGWGSTSFPQIDEISNNLNKLEGKIVDSSICKSAYEELQFGFTITDKQLCFGGNGHGFCSGDSGGPLICNGKGLCGIASWGYECGLDKYPGVFTNVGKYIDWIKENSKE